MADGVVLGTNTARDGSAGDAQRAHEIAVARDALLRRSIYDGILIGAAVLVALAVVAPSPPAVVITGCLFAATPLVLALATLGLANVRVPYFAVGFVTAALLVGAYCVTGIAATSGSPLSLALTASLLVLALVPYFAAVWASTAVAGKSELRPSLPCDAIGLVSVATLLIVSFMAVVGTALPHFAIVAPLLTALYCACILPPMIANWLQARREGKVPVKRGDKQPNHISGLGASTFILFAVVVVTLGLWAAATDTQASISVYAGLIVLFGLMIAFGIVAFGLPQSKTLGQVYGLLKLASKPIGWLFSTIDSLMVFAVANALGANSTHWIARFALLLGSLIPCAVLGWWLPAPFGLIPLTLALVGSVAIARRWAWMEEDRENVMLARKFQGDHIRVGFAQDLKDEALVGFAVLFVIVPIALRQLHLTFQGQAFEIGSAGDINELLAWLSFFGTEMAKAVPFVDWTEIYRVNGSSSIRLNEESVGIGQHIVFGMRILVDLVLLAAFLQAISIMQRTKKLKEMFYVEGTLNRLDPFIEPHEFRKLVERTPSGIQLNSGAFKDFPVYDPDRLEELKQLGDHDEVGFVAAKLLERDELGGPEEQLLREAKRASPNLEKCLALLEMLADAPYQTLKIGPLKAAHYEFNDRAQFFPVRFAIVQQIVRALPESVRVNALSEVLIGPAAGVQDPRQQVRLLALQALFHPAIEGNRVAQASIRHAASHDPAGGVKNAAREMLEYSSDW